MIIIDLMVGFTVSFIVISALLLLSTLWEWGKKNPRETLVILSWLAVFYLTGAILTGHWGWK